MKKPADILDRYIPILEEIVTRLNKEYEAEYQDNPATVERILEETISELVYDYRKFYDLAGPLPVNYINGKRYYRDDRLREFRNADDFADSIKFDS